MPREISGRRQRCKQKYEESGKHETHCGLYILLNIRGRILNIKYDTRNGKYKAGDKT